MSKRVKDKDLWEQCCSQEVHYLIGPRKDYSGENRIVLERYYYDEEDSWGDWFIEKDKEEVPELIDREYLEYRVLAMNKADKKYGKGK